jgi:hypothetical protein
MNHTDDIIVRLRNQNWMWTVPGALREEAAVKIEQLQAISQRALDHYDMRSELYTNDSDVAAGMADILRAPPATKAMNITAKEAMEIGMKIAKKHKADVLQIAHLGYTTEQALHGCIVSLAADIMCALQAKRP